MLFTYLIFYGYIRIYGTIKITEIKKVGSAWWKTNPSAVVHFSIKKKKKRKTGFQSPANNTLNVSARFANKLIFIFREYAYSETYYSGNIWLSSD